MVTIIDYGVGNLVSLVSSFAYIGEEAMIESDPEAVRRAEKLVLPGVGAFGDAAEKLRATGLGEAVTEAAGRGAPLLGICLGMQLLFEKSYEYGEHRGLGLIKGEIRPVADVIPEGYLIPHMGWNDLVLTGLGERCPIFKNTKTGDHVYFVHSFYAAGCESNVAATAEYGAPLTAAVMSDSGCVFGTQFHPEKSGEVGLGMLRAFAAL